MRKKLCVERKKIYSIWERKVIQVKIMFRECKQSFVRENSQLCEKSHSCTHQFYSLPSWVCLVQFCYPKNCTCRVLLCRLLGSFASCIGLFGVMYRILWRHLCNNITSPVCPRSFLVVWFPMSDVCLICSLSPKRTDKYIWSTPQITSPSN